MFATLTIVVSLVAHDPLVDGQSMGTILSSEQLDTEVTNIKEGSNAIILRNGAPRTAVYWNTDLDVSTHQCDIVIIPRIDDVKVKFVGMCDGGQIEVRRSIHISQMDHPIQKEWILLMGSGAESKTWAWNFDNTDEAVYDTGGWLTQGNPSRDVKLLSELGGGNRSLVFDLNGGVNVTRVDVNGKILKKGHLSFNMVAIEVNPSNGKQWSMGQLILIGVTVPSGYTFYEPDKKVTTFEILKLTDKELVLCYSAPDIEV